MQVGSSCRCFTTVLKAGDMAFAPLGFISFEKSINYSFCMRMPCIAVSANLENKADYTRLVAMVMALPITKLMPVAKKEWLQSLTPKLDAAIKAVDGTALETIERLGAEATDGMDVGDTALDASAASQEAEHVAAAPASEAAAEQTTTTPTAATEQNAATPKAAAEQTTAIPTAAAEQTAATPKAYMIINKKHMYIYIYIYL